MASNPPAIILGILLVLTMMGLVAFIIYHFITMNRYCPQVFQETTPAIIKK
jgi:hypothetical protein